MAKYIKNNTIAEQEWIGITIAAGAYRLIDIEDLELYQIDTTFLADLAASNVVMARDATGTTDFSNADDGRRFLLDVLILADDGTRTSDLEVASSLSFSGNITSTFNAATSTNIITVPEPDTYKLGGMHQLAFTSIGSAQDKWMVLYGDARKSNEKPAIMVWKSKLVGISFTNEKQSIETDAQIHVSSELDGSSPTTKVFEWQIRNSRVCRKTNFSPDIIFDSGDKISIYLKGQGTNPKDAVIVMYFQIILENSEEVCKTYSGDFSISGQGSNGSS